MCQVMDIPPLPAELNAARLLNHKYFSIFFAWSLDTVYPIIIYGDILLAHFGNVRKSSQNRRKSS